MANDEVDRRSEILNAAVECFGTLGYYGTSLQKIATMVGLTKAGVLHYVGSKEGLLHAVLDEMYDRDLWWPAFPGYSAIRDGPHSWRWCCGGQ